MGPDEPEEWHVAPNAADQPGLGEPEGPRESGKAEEARGLDEPGESDWWEESEDSDEDDDPWADDDDYPAPAMPSAPGRPGYDGTGRSFRRMAVGGNSPWLTVVVAVAAAVAGVAIGLAFLHSPGTGAAASPAASPYSGAPGNPGSGGGNGGLPTLPPLSGNGNGGLEMQITGTVTAVSGTSITIGGDGQSITGAITSSTTFDGTDRSAAAIKTGNEVTALLTGTPSKLTVTSIQDPATTS